MPVLDTPCALTLHIALATHYTTIAATAKRKEYQRAIPNTGDVDNLAGAFMDAGNGILYRDDAHVALLGAYKARSHEDSVSFDAIPLTRDNIPAIRAAWTAILDAAIADMAE
jgi:Holliday junction resolvase RusA-like endonuclease